MFAVRLLRLKVTAALTVDLAPPLVQLVSALRLYWRLTVCVFVFGFEIVTVMTAEVCVIMPDVTVPTPGPDAGVPVVSVQPLSPLALVALTRTV